MDTGAAARPLNRWQQMPCAHTDFHGSQFIVKPCEFTVPSKHMWKHCVCVQGRVQGWEVGRRPAPLCSREGDPNNGTTALLLRVLQRGPVAAEFVEGVCAVGEV